MLITTLGFLVLTAAFIWWQLRRGAGSASQSAAPVATRPCARCGVPVAIDAVVCSGCGISQQLFELVSAPTAAGAANDNGDLPPRAAVRADMCVGCGACVAACPEVGAITLRGKLAVVDDALCQGHGECVASCPMSAIAVTRGVAVNRVAVPLCDANFESNVRGLYIVGELGGRGLIKNAINEGKIAVEHVAAQLPPDAPRSDDDPDAFDVCIVGSGPAGLSAALEAHKAGLRYVVLEQGTISDSVRKYPRKKLLLAEPSNIPLYGDLWIADASKESLLSVWDTIVTSTGLDIRTGTKVERITREGALFDVVAAGAHYHARRVVLAMGRRGTPRRLGVPGEELDKVFYDIVEMEAFAGQRMLVVGGGDSAIESALGLANQPGTEVRLSYRGDDFVRVKPRNREKLERAMAAGRIMPMLGSEVREVRSDVVVLDIAGESTILPNDTVIVRIGGEAPSAFLEKLGVRIVEKDVPMPREVAKAG